jgi:hypothetical protein
MEIKGQQEGKLKFLIRKISYDHGGDDEQFLEAYISDVINRWSHDLDAALECFHSSLTQGIKGKEKGDER